MEMVAIGDDMGDQAAVEVSDDPGALADELESLVQRIKDALGGSGAVSTMGGDERGQGLEEGEGDRGDEREQSRDAGREHRASSSGKVSEAQVRRIIAKVLKERRKKGK
jgi:hypothetical protein